MLHLLDAKVFYPSVTQYGLEMSDDTSTPDYAAGRHTPAVVDSSLKGIPKDVTEVDVMPDRELNWLQAIRNDKVPEGPTSRSDQNLGERASEVWDVVEEMESSESLRQSHASD